MHPQVILFRYSINYVAGLDEKFMYSYKVNSKDELKVKDNGSLHQETIGKACRRFQSRLEAVVEPKGDFFE